MSAVHSYSAKCSIILMILFCMMIFTNASALNVMAKNDDEFIDCVKKYSETGKCVTCVGKQLIEGDTKTRLTKLIAHDYIIWTETDSWVAKCTNCTKQTASGLAVLRMTDELTEILKWNLWLEFEHAHDSNHFSYNESNLLEQYNTFMTMHGPDSKECLQIFGIRMGEKKMSKDDRMITSADDDDNYETYIKRMACLSAVILSGLGFVGYILRRVFSLYRETVQLRRNYSNLTADC